MTDYEKWIETAPDWIRILARTPLHGSGMHDAFMAGKRTMTILKACPKCDGEGINGCRKCGHTFTT